MSVGKTMAPGDSCRPALTAAQPCLSSLGPARPAPPVGGPTPHTHSGPGGRRCGCNVNEAVISRYRQNGSQGGAIGDQAWNPHRAPRRPPAESDRCQTVTLFTCRFTTPGDGATGQTVTDCRAVSAELAVLFYGILYVAGHVTTLLPLAPRGVLSGAPRGA